MSKYPRTKDGLARRRNNAECGYSKHRPGLQFNPHNGEPHSAKWLEQERAAGSRRWRDTNKPSSGCLTDNSKTRRPQ